MVDGGEENEKVHFDRMVELILPNIRFPMMTNSQLADLLLNPLAISHENLIVDKIRIGLSYHKNQLENLKQYDDRLFTPRLYTTEKFCASLSVDHFHELPAYHCRSLLFSSQKCIANYLDEDQIDWSIDVFPKGVWIQRALACFPLSGKEIPEKVFRTVRVSVTAKHADCFLPPTYYRQNCVSCQVATIDGRPFLKFKIGILVVGNQDNFEHIRCVKTRNYIFTDQEETLNFDDIVDLDELLNDKPKSNFLSGEEKTSFKILVTITPLSSHSSLCIS